MEERVVAVEAVRLPRGVVHRPICVRGKIMNHSYGATASESILTRQCYVTVIRSPVWLDPAATLS
jgi:hypothetical protein